MKYFAYVDFVKRVKQSKLQQLCSEKGSGMGSWNTLSTCSRLWRGTGQAAQHLKTWHSVHIWTKAWHERPAILLLDITAATVEGFMLCSTYLYAMFDCEDNSTNMQSVVSLVAGYLGEWCGNDASIVFQLCGAVQGNGYEASCAVNLKCIPVGF